MKETLCSTEKTIASRRTRCTGSIVDCCISACNELFIIWNRNVSETLVVCFAFSCSACSEYPGDPIGGEGCVHCSAPYRHRGNGADRRNTIAVYRSTMSAMVCRKPPYGPVKERFLHGLCVLPIILRWMMKRRQDILL